MPLSGRGRFVEKMTKRKVKICGLKAVKTIDAAVLAGADYIGFVFYMKSPRALTPELAADLARRIPTGTKIVGLFVNPDNELLEHVTSQVPLDMIQLHGDEDPVRVLEIKSLCHLPVIKAIPVAEPKDIMASLDYRDIADIILFDAKPPQNVVTMLPGGNGIAFDWDILHDIDIPMPWMLSGGLNPYNVTEAIEATDAPMVDVSSGVEVGPGLKDPSLIKEFISEVNRT